MASALLLFCWHLISPCQVVSSIMFIMWINDVKLCNFKWCFLAAFLWTCHCCLKCTKSKHPKLCLAYQGWCTYVLLVLFYQVKANEGRLSYVYPCVSLINQAFVICSFTILQRLAQLCFTWVILYFGDSRKWIIPSLNKLLHWKAGFQSLRRCFSLNFDKFSRVPFYRTPPDGCFWIFSLIFHSFIHSFIFAISELPHKKLININCNLINLKNCSFFNINKYWLGSLCIG